MGIKEQIQYWTSLYENENIDELLLRSRGYYRKGICLPQETRQGNISDILTIENRYPKSPLGTNGVLMPAFNHPHRIVSLIRERESKVEYIDEGLIKTYPIDKLVIGYKRYYNDNIRKELRDLTIGEVYRKTDIEDKNLKINEFHILNKDNPALIAFVFPSFIDDDEHKKQFEKELVDKMFVYGYSLSYISQVEDRFVIQPFKRKISLWTIVLEAKFFEIEPKLSDILYHVSPCRYFEKIKQQGLIPRSKSDVYKYPERVYLFNKASIKDILNYGVKKISLLKTHHRNPHVSDNGFYIFEIKKSKLEKYQPYIDKKLVFYLDPCYDGEMGGIKKSKAIFTYNNIPRSLLEDECWYYEIDGSSNNGKMSNIDIKDSR